LAEYSNQPVETIQNGVKVPHASQSIHLLIALPLLQSPDYAKSEIQRRPANFIYHFVGIM
jgi:hypothetical protein